MKFLSFLLTLPLLAANSVTITDQSGSTQTNRPFTVSRVFVKGEIVHYAQASVSGVGLVATQCDVKTRWPDGSVQHALISFVASVSANATITVSFVDQSSGNNSGAMNRAALLAATWDAQIEATNGTTQTANARQIVTDWDGTGSDHRVTYWMQGSICTQVILEDRTATLAYDMGWDAFKPLHPIFVVTFYPGTSAGAKVEMILENMWTTKLEDQTYSLVLKTGSPLASVFTSSNYTHVAETRWRKVFWSGSQPGTVNVDYNLPYMILSQVVPNWDLSKVIPPANVTADISDFTASDKGDLGGHALWLQDMPQTGGRYDLGLFPVWYVHYLFTFDPRLYDVMTGLAQVGGYVPSHLRESSTGLFFDSAGTLNAFGFPVSIDARPTLALVAGLSTGSDGITPVGSTTTGGWSWDLAHLAAFSYIPYLITGDWYFLEELQFAASEALITGNAAFNFYSRGDSFGYIPYSLQTRAVAWGLRDLAEAAFVSPVNTPQKAYYTEKMNNNIQIEEGFHNITNGAFPPADPLCPGYSPGPSADKWCYGRMTIGEGKSNPLHFLDHGDPYGGGCEGIDNLVPQGDPFACSYGGAPFEYEYKIHVMGHIQELGFPMGAVNQTALKFYLHQILDPATNPWLVGAYHMPVYRASTDTYYQTWADVLSAYNTAAICGNGIPGTVNWRTVNVWSACNGGSSDGDVTNPGYPHIARGAASYLAGLGINDGPLLGVDAWNWLVANVGHQSEVGQNPQYVLLPRSSATTTGAVSQNGAKLSGGAVFK